MTLNTAILMTSRKTNLLDANEFVSREAQIRSPMKKSMSHISASLLTLVLVLVLSQFELHGLRSVLYDGLTRLTLGARPSKDLVLIGYDDVSSYQYGGTLEVPADELVRVFKLLATEKPLAVALLSPLNNNVYSPADLTKIGDSLSVLPKSFLGYLDDETLLRQPPESLRGRVSVLPAIISKDSVNYSADSVTRRVMVSLEGLPTAFFKIASILSPSISVRSAHNERVGTATQTLIHWQGPPGTYSPIPMYQVTSGQVKPGQFTGKVVLIGSARNRIQDFVRTPYSRSADRTTTLEAIAQSIVTLARNNGIRKAPGWFDLFLTALIGVVTVNLVLHLSPGMGILLALGVSSLLVGGAWVALHFGNYWFHLGYPLIITCVGYYLVIPYRLLDEYRKRWHYQEKSELMAELEQLKSNFLSLISHDLKTPLARIQGNVELALRELSQSGAHSFEHLESVLRTTEDLSQHVESILDLTRIESGQVLIQKTSRDINETVTEVLSQKTPLALEKNIQIESKLEPLFSFKHDVRLMKRVIANLIENAIKYSNENTKIVVQTKDEGDWVSVSVIDEGLGISEEDQSKVFAKFYRCAGPSHDQVKGTGLGLYLVKYFVELHQGLIDLKSEIGKGSRFTIRLPM